MKLLQPVAWTKGAFLTPQHLQAQDAYFENLLRFCLEAVSDYPWGFIQLSIDQGQLERGFFAITKASGIFPDGLPFELPGTDPPPAPRALKDLFPAGEDAADLVLAVPAYRHSEANVSLSSNSAKLRFSINVSELRDENEGGSEKAVQLAKKNLMILTTGEAEEGYVSLSAGRVRKAGPGKYLRDPEFVPPSLQVAASSRLLAMVSELLNLLLARASTLSADRRHRRAGLAHFGSTDIARFWLIYTINSNFPVIRHHGKTSHPARLYEAMLSLAGSLTAFSTEIQPNQFPVYNHANPTNCFRELDGTIRRLLETVIPTFSFSFPLPRIRQFIYGMAIDPTRFLLPGVTAWIGIRSQSVTREALWQLAPQVVKVGSRSQIDELYQQAVRGLRLKLTTEPEAAASGEFTYFQLDTLVDDWKRIQRAGDIAVYIPESIPDPTLELILVLPEKHVTP